MRVTQDTGSAVELSKRGKVADPFLRQALGAAAAVASITCGLQALAISIDTRATEHNQQHHHEFQRSKIVAGVWSLVLSHQPIEGCKVTAALPTDILSCHPVPDNPRLNIEQCRRDVANARQQLWTVSFDERLNEISPGCYDDWVVVGADMWSREADGSKVKFAGTPNSHLEK